MLRAISFVLLLALSCSTLIAQTREQNFVLCREGKAECDKTVLTDYQKQVVSSFESGRNMVACLDAGPDCDATKLSPDQITVVRERLAKTRTLAAAANFSACAYALPDCDTRKLTAEQTETLRNMFAQQREVEQQTQAEAPSIARADPEPKETCSSWRTRRPLNGAIDGKRSARVFFSFSGRLPRPTLRFRRSSKDGTLVRGSIRHARTQ